MRKVGRANLAKALGFNQQRNWMQTLRYGELAATKLKQLKDRRLDTVENIDTALVCKLDALQRLNRQREAHEIAKERYTLWAMNHMRNPGSMRAALSLIQCCIHNGEYEDAEHYARHAMFMINEMTDNFIPADERPKFLADGSYYLARAIHRLAEAGGIPPEDKQKKGEESIELARKALEIYTQLHGTMSAEVAGSMSSLANVLGYFNDVDDDDVLRLLEQSIAIYRRVEGSSSVNVAACENNLGNAYKKRAGRAQAANDLDRELANLELTLPPLREAARIYSTANRVDDADDVLRKVTQTEEFIRRIGIARAAATTTTAATTTAAAAETAAETAATTTAATTAAAAAETAAAATSATKC